MAAVSHRVLKFGMWSTRDGQEYELTWVARTGWLYLDGDRIARIADEERLENALTGWGDHLGQPNSIAWLVGRLDGVR